MKRKREGSKEAKSEPFQNQSLFWGNLANENLLFVQLLFFQGYFQMIKKKNWDFSCCKCGSDVDGVASSDGLRSGPNVTGRNSLFIFSFI